MEKEILDAKTCGNCKYYLQYYIKLNVRFRTVYSGMCKHKSHKKLTKIKPDFVCEHWEGFDIKKAEQQDSIKAALWNISKRLNDIADVLNNDIDANK